MASDPQLHGFFCPHCDAPEFVVELEPGETAGVGHCRHCDHEADVDVSDTRLTRDDALLPRT